MSSNFTVDFLKSIRPGSRLILKDLEDGDFEGILNSINFRSGKAFTVILEKCHRVGGKKFIPGLQDFESDTIDDIEVLEQVHDNLCHKP